MTRKQKVSSRALWTRSLQVFWLRPQLWSTRSKSRTWKFTWRKFAICWTVSTNDWTQDSWYNQLHFVNNTIANVHSFWCLLFYIDIAINDNLPIHEEKNRGVYVKGLFEVYVSSISEIHEVMRNGGNNRMVAYTSRFIFVLLVDHFKAQHNDMLVFLCFLILIVPFEHRHERGEFAITFHLRCHNLTEELGWWKRQERKTVPSRSGWFGKGRQDRSLWSNTGGSQKD